MTSEDVRALERYQREFECTADYLEREKRRIFEGCEIPSKTQGRVARSTPEWIHKEVTSALAILKQF